MARKHGCPVLRASAYLAFTAGQQALAEIPSLSCVVVGPFCDVMDEAQELDFVCCTRTPQRKRATASETHDAHHMHITTAKDHCPTATAT